MDQAWFEMRDVRARFFAKAVWIPFRASQTLIREEEFGYAGFKEEFFGAGSLAVPLASKERAQGVLDWDEVGISHEHSGHIEDGQYVPVEQYRDFQGRFEGEHLVMEQLGNRMEPPQWHRKLP